MQTYKCTGRTNAIKHFCLKAIKYNCSYPVIIIKLLRFPSWTDFVFIQKDDQIFSSSEQKQFLTRKASYRTFCFYSCIFFFKNKSCFNINDLKISRRNCLKKILYFLCGKCIIFQWYLGTILSFFCHCWLISPKSFLLMRVSL